MNGKRLVRTTGVPLLVVALTLVGLVLMASCGSAQPIPAEPAYDDPTSQAVDATFELAVESAPVSPTADEVRASVHAAAAVVGETLVPAFDAADQAVDRWGLAMTTCPSPSVGSLASAWRWASPADEQTLLGLDLHGASTTFDLLADYEGTSIIIRVRDSETRDSLAVIKTNSSNTRVTAEIYAYRLAVFLGFEHLVPPSVPVPLDGDALQKMRDLLADTSYDDDYKERARQQVVRELGEAIASGTAYDAAVKPWLGAFMFNQALGERDRLVNHAVMPHLLAGGPQPGDSEVELVQITRLYSPAGTHRGRLTMAELAEDLSNLMLMDALMGQNDRFAGANLHFQSVSGDREEVGERNGRPVFDLGPVRLLALDNGAALRGRHGTGLNDLAGAVMAGTRVERFEDETLDRVRALGRRVLGHGCDAQPFDDEVDAVWAYLGVDDVDRRARASQLLGDVLAYLDDLEARHGDAIRLEPVVQVVHDPSADEPSAAAD